MAWSRPGHRRRGGRCQVWQVAPVDPNEAKDYPLECWRCAFASNLTMSRTIFRAERARSELPCPITPRPYTGRRANDSCRCRQRMRTPNPCQDGPQGLWPIWQLFGRNHTARRAGIGSAPGRNDVIEDENIKILYPFESRVVADEAGCPRDDCCSCLDHIRHGLAMNRP